MRCRACHTSSAKPSLHTNQLEDVRNDPKDSERLTLAWKREHQSKNAFKVGRNGDHTLVPFECDTCVFRKLKGVDPIKERAEDKLLLVCIGRESLHAIWIRATSTVNGQKDCLAFALKMSARVGLEGPYKHFGPYSPMTIVDTK